MEKHRIESSFNGKLKKTSKLSEAQLRVTSEAKVEIIITKYV